MSTPTFNTRHTVTGKLQRLTEDQISSFPKFLDLVEDDAKPYEPGMFKPGKVGEFKDSKPSPSAVAGKPSKGKAQAEANPKEAADSSETSETEGDSK